MLLDGLAAHAPDIDALDGAGHRVESSGQHHGIEIEAGVLRLDAGGGEILKRISAQIDQRDVVAIVRRVIAGIDARPLGAERVILGREQFGDLGILHLFADLGGDEIGDDLVGFGINALIGKAAEQPEPAPSPAPFQFGLDLFRWRVDGDHVFAGLVPESAHCGAAAGAISAGVLQPFLEIIVWNRAIVGRHRIIGRALEHGEVRGGFGDDRDRLDGRRSSADDADALSAEIHALMRPARGAIDGALIILDAGEGDIGGHGQAAGGHHHKAGRDHLAAVERDVPAIGLGIPVGGGHAGVEADVGFQVKTFGDMVCIGQQFGLRRIALRPAPFLFKFFIKAEAVFQALDIDAGAGIAIPVPGAANAAAGLDHAGLQALLPAFQQHVHAGKSGPHNQHIQTVCHDLLPNLAAPPQGHDHRTLPRPELGQSWEY